MKDRRRAAGWTLLLRCGFGSRMLRIVSKSPILGRGVDSVDSRKIDVYLPLCDYPNLSKFVQREPLAQLVEHLPFKQRVAGSSPARLI